MAEGDDPGFVFIPVPPQINFGSTTTMFDQEGNKILTDTVVPSNGETYTGMAASMADVPQYESDETSTLDDPGSMTKFHTKQRFPVGTETASKKVIGPVTTYTLWKYNTSRYFDLLHFKWVNGFEFDQAGLYSSKGGQAITASVKDLYTKGGYWYRGVRYT